MNVKLTDKDKIKVSNPDDLYDIMQRILLRENKIDREKEHFWIVGMNDSLVILYIELVSMGSVKATLVEPMNVFRVAVLKGATRTIAVHNHPHGDLRVSEDDKDSTDRLIQAGKILNIPVEDHMIISTKSYVSFELMGLMDELKKSLKYVPPYEIIEQVKKEQQAILKEELKKQQQEFLEYRVSAVNNLSKKNISVEDIANILDIPVAEVQKILGK